MMGFPFIIKYVSRLLGNPHHHYNQSVKTADHGDSIVSLIPQSLLTSIDSRSQTFVTFEKVMASLNFTMLIAN
jgi:hypothetical protein